MLRQILGRMTEINAATIWRIKHSVVLFHLYGRLRQAEITEYYLRRIKELNR